MKRSIKRAFSENDERYTPQKLVRLIAPYMAETAERKFRDSGDPLYVWCPFDSEESVAKMRNSKYKGVLVKRTKDSFSEEAFFHNLFCAKRIDGECLI